MKLDRALIKSQAQALIKGNVFKFFILIFVVTLLAQGGSIYTSLASTYTQVTKNLDSTFSDNRGGLYDADEYDFNEFNDIEDFDGFIEDFPQQQENRANNNSRANAAVLGGLGALSSAWSIAMLFLAPLAITLAGVFYQLIKGNNLSWSDEFNYVFTKTFDKNYWNKFLLNLLKGIFTTLLLCLFIIPGVIFYYKYYFTSYIMAEKPELSWKEAMNISKKMTDGHKGELFVLDLSFIGWDLLVGITFGLAGIYVLPYVYTTQALYYENFKLRAFQLGVMSEADYLTESERAAMAYANAAQAPEQGYYQPQPIQAPVQDNSYQAPVGSANPVSENPEAASAPIEENQPSEGTQPSEE